ncbi:MAG: hypothetical protein C0605_07930 [Hyphomicrobiales bacterium]|nr:MAG: hypothetical protein C0605_07930 [Hyphomicrobiales bacterium]
MAGYDVAACFDDELMVSVSYKVLQASGKATGEPGLPPNASAYASDTVAIADDGFRPIVMHAPYMPGQERIVEPAYCIHNGSSTWYSMNYSGVSGDCHVDVDQDQIEFLNGRHTDKAWLGAEGDRVAALVLAEQIDAETPQSGSATRVHIGRRDASGTGVYVTKSGLNADTSQQGNRLNFSSDLETLDAEVSGSYTGLASNSSVTIAFSPARSRIPFGLFMWRPSNSDGEISFGFGSMTLNYDRGYDPIRTLVHDYTGLGGVEFNIYKTGISVVNSFFSPVDFAYLIFDNPWEPAP